MTRLSPLVLLALAAGAAGCAADSSPAPLTETVQVSGGILEGVREDGALVFRGVPFAAASCFVGGWPAGPRVRRRLLAAPVGPPFLLRRHPRRGG